MRSRLATPRACGPRSSLTLGVEANYLSAWSADLSYTAFYGADDLNLISDRDFVSFTVKYSF